MLCMKFIKKENKMTNKEYIEKNNISFSEAMKMYDNKTSCINDWLNQEYHEHKFKVGDFVIINSIDTHHYLRFIIREIQAAYILNELMILLIP